MQSKNSSSWCLLWNCIFPAPTWKLVLTFSYRFLKRCLRWIIHALRDWGCVLSSSVHQESPRSGTLKFHWVSSKCASQRLEIALNLGYSLTADDIWRCDVSITIFYETCSIISGRKRETSDIPKDFEFLTYFHFFLKAILIDSFWLFWPKEKILVRSGSRQMTNAFRCGRKKLFGETV